MDYVNYLKNKKKKFYKDEISKQIAIQSVAEATPNPNHFQVVN